MMILETARSSSRVSDEERHLLPIEVTQKLLDSFRRTGDFKELVSAF